MLWSSPTVLSLIRSLAIGWLLARMIRLWPVCSWILRVTVGRSILGIVRRYCWESDIIRQRHALMISSGAIILLSRWRRVFGWRWRILRLAEIARVSWRWIWSTWLFGIRHVWIDRHGDEWNGCKGGFLRWNAKVSSNAVRMRRKKQLARQASSGYNRVQRPG